MDSREPTEKTCKKLRGQMIAKTYFYCSAGVDSMVSRWSTRGPTGFSRPDSVRRSLSQTPASRDCARADSRRPETAGRMPRQGLLRLVRDLRPGRGCG